MILQDFGLPREALTRIVVEDQSQISKFGNQKHHLYEWYIILAEEVGELAKAMLEESAKEISKEAIQIATLATKISWMVDEFISLQGG